jgi:23S rRNA-/tRNA-specific pseudouridylate synthase
MPLQVSRIYTSVVAGVPSPPAARITTNILRDPANRLRMTTAAYGTARGRTAASNYQLLQVGVHSLQCAVHTPRLPMAGPLCTGARAWSRSLLQT